MSSKWPLTYNMAFHRQRAFAKIRQLRKEPFVIPFVMNLLHSLFSIFYKMQKFELRYNDIKNSDRLLKVTLIRELYFSITTLFEIGSGTHKRYPEIKHSYRLKQSLGSASQSSLFQFNIAKLLKKTFVFEFGSRWQRSMGSFYMAWQ